MASGNIDMPLSHVETFAESTYTAPENGILIFPVVRAQGDNGPAGIQVNEDGRNYYSTVGWCGAWSGTYYSVPLRKGHTYTFYATFGARLISSSDVSNLWYRFYY